MSEENQNKQQFLLGLFGGIAVVAVIGLIILGIVFINTTKGSSNVADNSQPTQPSGSQPSAPIDIKITDSDHIRGDKNAPITILEWSDIQCPFCSRFHNSVKRILAEYPGKVRWVFRHFPLDSLHQYARKASEATECAHEQGKFDIYIDELFANQSSIQSGGINYLKEAAGTIGLDTGKFNKCLDDEKYKGLVNEHYQAGLSAGVRGTPGSFLNGQSLGGALPYEQLKAKINAILQ